MSNSKYYPNPNRSAHLEHEPYVPQYQLHGINPTPVRGFGGPVPSVAPPKQDMMDPKNNPRIRSIPQALPYATDGSYEDDYQFYDQNYSEESFKNESVRAEQNGPTWTFSRESSYDVINDVNDNEDLSRPHLQNEPEPETRSIKEMQKESYVLIFEDNILCIGDLETVEPIIYDLLTGTHEITNGRSVDIDEVILLKRVGVKFGLFFEE